MLNEGQPAPDFVLPNQDGEPVRLADLRGRTVVLYFYPKDNTPGCTKEACGFRDLEQEFARQGAVILGVSPDSVASHRRFAEKFQLPFPLLSDEKKEVLQRYGVWKQKSLYGRAYMGVERTTVVIDADGIVRKIYPKVKVSQHPEAVLAFVQSLQG